MSPLLCGDILTVAALKRGSSPPHPFALGTPFSSGAAGMDIGRISPEMYFQGAAGNGAYVDAVARSACAAASSPARPHSQHGAAFWAPAEGLIGAFRPAPNRLEKYYRREERKRMENDAERAEWPHGIASGFKPWSSGIRLREHCVVADLHWLRNGLVQGPTPEKQHRTGGNPARIKCRWVPVDTRNRTSRIQGGCSTARAPPEAASVLEG